MEDHASYTPANKKEVLGKLIQSERAGDITDLMKQGVAVSNVTDNDGMTALKHAAYDGNLKWARYLVEKDAKF